MDKELLFKIKLAQDAQAGASLKKLADDVRATMRDIETSIGRVGVAAGNAMSGRTSTGTLPGPRSNPGPRFSPGSTQGPTFSGSNDPLDRIRGTTTDDVVGPRHNTPRPTRNMPEPKQVPTEAAVDHSAIYEKNVQKITEYDEKSKTLTRNLKANFREATEKIEGGASALGQFASGMAFLTAGNKDMEQFIKTLATIKGVSDVGIGAIKMFTSLAQIVTVNEDKQEMLSEKQELAAKKAAALTAATRAHKAMLDAEGSQLSEANAKLHEHASALDQVAASARGAASAEGQFGTATDGAATRAGGSARGRRGGRGGLAAGIGGMIGGEAITTFGGGGIASVLGGMGIESLIGRAAAGGAGGAAGGGAAAVGIGALGTAAAAAAAALGGVALAGITIKESFEGTATKMGSVSDTIASVGVRWIDWARDSIGSSGSGFDLVGGSGVDAKMKKFQAKQVRNDFQTSLTDDLNVMRRDREEALFSKEMQGRSSIKKFDDESGRGSLYGLGLDRDNLRAELAREAQTGKLLSMDNTSAGQQKLRESQERMDRTRQQISTVNGLEQGIVSAGGQDPQAELNERRALSADEYKKTLAEIAKIEAEGAKYQGQYVNELKRAERLSNDLVAIEQEELALIKSQKDERARANQEGISALNQRISLVQQEGLAAKNALKSGAERFASMSDPDQARAIDAIERAKSGDFDSLQDKDRSLFRNVGTQEAVAFAERADQMEAERKGFFSSFGGSEQKQVAEADAQVRQMKVELTNKMDISVTVENDFKAALPLIRDIAEAAVARGIDAFRKASESDGQKNERVRIRQANSEILQAKNAKEI